MWEVAMSDTTKPSDDTSGTTKPDSTKQEPAWKRDVPMPERPNRRLDGEEPKRGE